MNDADLAHLLNTPPGGVHALPTVGAEAVTSAAAALGFATFRVDLDACPDKAALLARVATGLGFPDWFGHNWDALADCLTDMSWRPAPGYVVILEHTDTLHGDAADALATALEIFDEAGAQWARQSVAWWVFIAPDERAASPRTA